MVSSVGTAGKPSSWRRFYWRLYHHSGAESSGRFGRVLVLIEDELVGAGVTAGAVLVRKRRRQAKSRVA